jgi:predicted lipoprotein with Yx(FWY)xxD motif
MRRSAVLLLLMAALVTAGGAFALTPGTKVLLRSTSLGDVLVASSGRTLYLFDADAARKSTCSGRCAAVWPPLLTRGVPRAGAGLKASLLGTTRRRDGKLQVTYAGHPLYYFAQDAKPGQVQGEGIEHFGGGWYAVSAAGKKVELEPASTSTTTGGYGDYGP